MASKRRCCLLSSHPFPPRHSLVGRFVLAVFGLATFAMVAPVRGEDWPQWRGPGRDGIWNETGLIESFVDEVIPRRWSVPIGAGYSGPTVADGRVLVMDRMTEPDETERVLCLDAETGRELWVHTYPSRYDGIGYTAGPRASVTVDRGLAVGLGAAGHLSCLELDDGRVRWQRDLREDFKIRMPNWGIAASPLIEGERIFLPISGEGDACVVALDRLTGNTLWQALPDEATYSSPILIDQAGRRVLVVWTGQRVVGLKPEDGGLLWEHPFPWVHWPIGIASPVLAREYLLVSEVHQGSLLLQLDQAEPSVAPVWHLSNKTQDEPSLHCLMSTPLVIDDHIYGADENGILRCLDLLTGEQVWEDDSAVPTIKWATIHMVRNDDRVWMFNDRGELIIAALSPRGFRQISRAKLIDPTTEQLRRRDGVTWAHPAYANRHVFVRNDRELVCADLSAAGR
ncbi:MAG: dehydrogenase [Planctomycetaceae bacterium]|nr:MAG: dehydrogenase [Planctomycetaceae bacterium]